MRPVGLFLTVCLVLAVAVWVVTDRSSSGAFGIALTAQQSPALSGAKWTTTRLVSVTCHTRGSGASSASPSDRALCNAVTYYSHHVPTRPCIGHGVIVKYTRVVITGSPEPSGDGPLVNDSPT
jgi:hypothetical protein